MTPTDRLRDHNARELARAIDPWAEAWEDGRPPQVSRARALDVWTKPWRPHPPTDATDAPDWPEAPTEEVP